MSGDPAANPAPRLLAAGANLEELASAAQGCTACDLYRNATQAVFGEGPVPAAVMLVGEQPGDREDEQGHPFVGPPGRLLDRALGGSLAEFSSEWPARYRREGPFAG